MITHEELIKRGFKPQKGRSGSYRFKNTPFGGTFLPSFSNFYFWNAYECIQSLNDLDLIIKMIEYVV